MFTISQEELEKLSGKIKQVDFGMFTTVNDGGHLTSRPLTSQQLDQYGQLWFFTSDESGFTRDLLDHPQVNVSFSDIKDNLYVSVTGRAELLKDPKKAQELWSPVLKAWFPEGLDDPHLALIKLEIDGAEYWETTAGKMVQLFGMVKAMVTGERLDYAGKHEEMGRPN